MPLASLPAAGQSPEEVARRVAATASIAVVEYALGVVDGRVVLPEEYDEAGLFFAEARHDVEQLPDAARAGAAAVVARLIRAHAAVADVATLRAEVETLRRILEDALGVALDPFPAGPPSLAAGARLYEANCVKCHGAGGRGDGARAPDLVPPPSDLSDAAALREASPLDFFRKISFGVAGTDMAEFGTGLTVEERWHLALYVSGLRHHGDGGAGRAWVERACPACRIVLSDLPRTAGASDDSLLTLITSLGRAPRDTAAVLAFARIAPAREALGGDRSLAAERAAGTARAALDDAVVLAAQGRRRDAAGRALEGYLAFEAIERMVAARNPRAARRVELAFGAVRAAIERGETQLEAAGAEAATALEGAVAVVARRADPPLLFGQSILIMLREGLEAILIIGALIAFLVRAGAADRVKEIGWGAAAALGASFLTAGVFAFVFRVSAAHQELLEGLTMLIAAAVLFTVASWLVSKVEAEKWKAFVGGQMQKALGSRGKLALASLAFLVVYREGFETVLFYAALYSSAESPVGAAGVTAGMVLGAVLLAGIYVAIRRYGVKLPLKPIFAVTGVLLLVLAFSFAGQGVAELQEAGLVGLTPLSGLPTFPLLGVFPTVQTLGAQLVLVAAFLSAAGWIFWWQPRAAPAVSRGR